MPLTLLPAPPDSKSYLHLWYVGKFCQKDGWILVTHLFTNSIFYVRNGRKLLNKYLLCFCSSFLSFDYSTYIKESRKCPMFLGCASPDGVGSTDKNCCLSCVLFKFSNMSQSRIQAWPYLCWYKTLTHTFIRRPLICWKFLCAQPCRLKDFTVLFIFFHEIDYAHNGAKMKSYR